MEQFILTLIFVLPGLLGYYWLAFLGVTPTQKHNSFEMLSISILLWVPITVLNVGVYNIIACSKQVEMIYNLDLLISLSKYLSFQLYYVISSIIFSYLFARLWTSNNVQEKTLAHINRLREKRKLAGFSRLTTVWDECFTTFKTLVVEISSLSNPENKIVGCIRKTSRPLEPERNLVIDDIEYFTNLVSENHISIDSVFVDVKTGLIIKIFNRKEIEEAQN